jgi:hypothetical protein
MNFGLASASTLSEGPEFGFEKPPRIEMEVSGGIHVEGDGDGVVVGEKRKLDSDSVVDDLPDCVMDPRPDKRQQGGVQGEGEEDYGGIVTTEGVGVPGQVAPSQHEDDMGDVVVAGAPPSGSKENSKEKRKMYRAARVSALFLFPTFVPPLAPLPLRNLDALALLCLLGAAVFGPLRAHEARHYAILTSGCRRAAAEPRARGAPYCLPDGPPSSEDEARARVAQARGDPQARFRVRQSPGAAARGGGAPGAGRQEVHVQ